MQKFCNKLNASDWQGVISEVGIGLEFSSRYLRVPGASKTIIGVNCDYSGDAANEAKMRAVSFENACRMAKDNLIAAGSRKTILDSVYKSFGLAITGAHYKDRPSNVWVYIATNEWDAHMHFSIVTGDTPFTETREQIGRMVSDRVQWFMNACFLSNDTWVKHINDIYPHLGRTKIDVLYGPGLSDIERLLLLHPENPLAYHNGQFRRVVDCLRDHPKVFPGSFNPPTMKHLSTEDCMFEISQQHHHKTGVSLEDLIHRVRMLDAAGRPTLLTHAPNFVDKYKVLVESCEVKAPEFIVGADTWNILVSPLEYPDNEWLKRHLEFASFEVMTRAGVPIVTNAVTETLTWSITNTNSDLSRMSSSDVRSSKEKHMHSAVSPEVVLYITKQDLYK